MRKAPERTKAAATAEHTALVAKKDDAVKLRMASQKAAVTEPTDAEVSAVDVRRQLAEKNGTTAS